MCLTMPCRDKLDSEYSAAAHHCFVGRPITLESEKVSKLPKSESVVDVRGSNVCFHSR